MAQYSRTISIPCPGKLLEAINADGGITPTCVQIINTGGSDLIFEFDGSLSGGEVITFEGLLSGWTCPSEDSSTPADEFSVDDENTGSDVLWSSQQITDFFQSGSLPVLQYNESNGESSTTSTSYQRKVRLSATIPETGFYMLMWSAEVSNERYTRTFGIRMQVNDTTTIQELVWAPIVFDSYGTPAPASGFMRLYLTAGTANIDLDYRSMDWGETVTIRRARLGLMRVSD